MALRKLVLFDIDGTILWTDGAGRRAIHRALLAEMGTAGPVENFRFDGKTDPQIVRELLTLAGHPLAGSEPHISSVCQRYVELLREELAASEPSRLRIFPGIEAVMERLEARGDVLLGLLTGNVVEGASLKLTACGLAPSRFPVGAFGSDAADRAMLPPIAAQRAAALMGRMPSGHDVVIIGDTPSDVTCGSAIGARAIGVATGFYKRQDLEHAGAYAAFDSFAAPEPVLRAILA